MRQLRFDRTKHRYARLSDGSVEPLYSDDPGKPRFFRKTEFGWWYLDFSRHDTPINLRITEFMEDNGK